MTRANALNVRGLLFLAVGVLVGWLLGLWVDSYREEGAAVVVSVAGGVVIMAIVAHDRVRVQRVAFWGALLGLVLVPVAIGVFWLLGGPPYPLLARHLTLAWGLSGFLLGLYIALLYAAVWKPAATPAPEASTEAAETKPPRCDYCKEEMLHPALLQERRRAFSGQSAAICPRCARQRKRRENLLTMPIMLVALVPCVLFVVADPYSRTGWALFSVWLLIVFSELLVVAHEFGHALAAKVAGMRIFRVYIGHGVSVFNKGRWGWFYEPELLTATAGMVVGGYPNLRGLRARVFLFALGGPLVNAVLLVAALQWVSFGEAVEEIMEVPPRLMAGTAFIVANVFALLVTLWPFQVKVGGEVHTPDGAQMRTALFHLGEEERRQLRAAYLFMEGTERMQLCRFAEAAPWFEEGLREFPDLPGFLFGLASCMHRLRETERALSLWQEYLAQAEPDPWLRTVARDALATTYLERLLDPDCPDADRARLLEEVDAISRESVQEPGTDPRAILSLFGTRGCVLIEMGQLDEGSDVLRRVLGQTQADEDKAYSEAYLAVAALRQGKPDLAGEHLERAERWDATCTFLPPVRRLFERDSRAQALPGHA